MKTMDFRTDVLPLKDKLFRLALRITLDRQEAEDITQETLIKVWEKRDEWHQIQNMEAYCLTIARHLAIDATKSKRSAHLSLSETNETLHATDLLPDDDLDLRQRVAAIRNLINELPEVQRTIVQLRDIEGLRYNDIAQVTGLTETQVKVYLHRARKKIKDLLEK